MKSVGAARGFPMLYIVSLGAMICSYLSSLSRVKMVLPH